VTETDPQSASIDLAAAITVITGSEHISYSIQIIAQALKTLIQTYEGVLCTGTFVINLV
jgi:hypothetical protein